MTFEQWKRKLESICNRELGTALDEAVGIDGMLVARSFHRNGSSPRDFFESHVMAVSTGDDMVVREMESDLRQEVGV